MLLAGILGVIAAAIGIHFRLNTVGGFTVLWLGTAALVVAGAFYIARKQAGRDNEFFWSPPTKRVAQALLPPLLAGLLLGILFGLGSKVRLIDFIALLPFLWSFSLRLRLPARGGIFMPRGVRWYGWLYIIAASIRKTILCDAGAADF